MICSTFSLCPLCISPLPSSCILFTSRQTPLMPTHFPNCHSSVIRFATRFSFWRHSKTTDGKTAPEKAFGHFHHKAFARITHDKGTKRGFLMLCFYPFTYVFVFDSRRCNLKTIFFYFDHFIKMSEQQVSNFDFFICLKYMCLFVI